MTNQLLKEIEMFRPKVYILVNTGDNVKEFSEPITVGMKIHNS